MPSNSEQKHLFSVDFLRQILISRRREEEPGLFYFAGHVKNEDNDPQRRKKIDFEEVVICHSVRVVFVNFPNKNPHGFKQHYPISIGYEILIHLSFGEHLYRKLKKRI